MLRLIEILSFVVFIAALGSLVNGSSLPLLGEGARLAVIASLAASVNIIIGVCRSKKRRAALNVSEIHISKEGEIKSRIPSEELPEEYGEPNSKQIGDQIPLDVNKDEFGCLLLEDAEELLAVSRNRPVLLITHKAERGAGEEVAFTRFLEAVFPELEKRTKNYDCVITWLNISLTAKRSTLRNYLVSNNWKYKGAFLFRDGNCIANVKFKFSDWDGEIISKASGLLETGLST